MVAAAVTFQRMAEGLPALQRRVSAIRVFGLNDYREGSYWEVAFIYNKSLLNIVSSLCEADPEADRPLLGMQRYWSGSRPYDQPYIRASHSSLARGPSGPRAARRRDPGIDQMPIGTEGSPRRG